MSGDQFVRCLLRLGFAEADHKHGKSFDWMFEDRVLSPFLEWFCDNLQEGNLISPKDFKEFVRIFLKLCLELVSFYAMLVVSINTSESIVHNI